MNKRVPKILTVKAAWNLTPNMIRVTLAAPEIGCMESDCAGANCKLFLPEIDQSRDAFTAQLTDGPRPVVRTYTVRQIRTDACEMDIDFVDHGDGGPASAWARRAKVGGFLGFAGPGPVKVNAYYADSYLVVADMSALPVAAATLEAMPEDAVGTAIFEIMSAADKQDFRIPKGIKAHWIVNPDPHKSDDTLPKMLVSFDWPSGVIQTCIAGESGMIKTLRQELLVTRSLPKDDCYISGYWKIGLIEDEHQKLKRSEAASA
jgi:NADPH-dependent ferric siderophore reductase